MNLQRALVGGGTSVLNCAVRRDPSHERRILVVSDDNLMTKDGGESVNRGDTVFRRRFASGAFVGPTL